MIKEFIFKGKLVATRTDWMGYTNHVFENLESSDIYNKYVMCTQFPYWDQKPIHIGDIGYVSVRYVTAGTDAWFNGQTEVPYRKTDVHFLKFIQENKKTEDVTLVL